MLLQAIVELVGPNQAVQIFGVKLVGVTAATGRKVVLSLAVLVVLTLLARAAQTLVRAALAGERRVHSRFWWRQTIRLGKASAKTAAEKQKQAEALGWKWTRILTEAEGDHDSTDYVLLTNNAPFLADTPVDSPDEPEPTDVPLWTDRYHNLFQILVKE